MDLCIGGNVFTECFLAQGHLFMGDILESLVTFREKECDDVVYKKRACVFVDTWLCTRKI